ncbi:MAG TPA: hypothetical protein VE291_10695 [Terracidiphilus sp.]|jgi:uncharacterized protein YjgD (DUF1641 family)|nr:hypothetical protein [Terracidiphilus sp.]
MEAEQKAAASDSSQEEAQATASSNKRNGADAMRDAADKALKKSSDEIATGLVESAKTGHMMSARLLYMIANDQVRMTAAEIKRARSLAAEWAAERKWLSSVQQQPAETPNGTPAPES